MIIAQQLPGAVWLSEPSEALSGDPAAPAALGQLFDPFGTSPTVQAFATEEGFANGLSFALGGLTPQIRADFQANNPAVHDAVLSLSAVLQAVGGSAPGTTMEIQAARIVAQVVTKIASGVASIASEIGGQVSAAIADMGAAIPLIGAYVSMVIDVIEAATYPAVTASEEATIKNDWLNYCASVIGRAKPVGTGSMGKVDPADLFRGVLFSGSTYPERNPGVPTSRHLPPGIAAIAVLMCGPAAHGFGYTAAGWKADTTESSSPFHQTIPGMKIPSSVQRSMWKIIQSIMASVRDPDAFAVFKGDNGRSMMPLLAQILADQHKRGNWTIETARWFADYRIPSIHTREFVIPGQGMRAGSARMVMPACSAAGYDIGGTFWEFVRGWQTCVEEGKCAATQRAAPSSAARLRLGLNASYEMVRRARASEAPASSVAPAALSLLAAAGAIVARRYGL
jgi:hypothetical protein